MKPKDGGEHTTATSEHATSFEIVDDDTATQKFAHPSQLRWQKAAHKASLLSRHLRPPREHAQIKEEPRFADPEGGETPAEMMPEFVEPQISESDLEQSRLKLLALEHAKQIWHNRHKTPIHEAINEYEDHESDFAVDSRRFLRIFQAHGAGLPAGTAPRRSGGLDLAGSTLDVREEALRKDPELRRKGEIDLLMDWLSKINCFKDFQQATLFSLSKVINLLHLDTDEPVFMQGDIGDKFYVMIKGAVNIIFEEKVSKTSSSAPRCCDVLGPGQYFGEIALNKGTPRSASIITAKPTTLVTLSREDYHSILRVAVQQELADKVEFLGSLSAFRHWSQRDVSRLAGNFRPETFQRHSVICKQGDHATTIYFVKSGECRMYKQADFYHKKRNWTQTKNLDVATLTKYSCFGDTEAFCGVPWVNTVVCDSDVEVIATSSAVLWRMDKLTLRTFREDTYMKCSWHNTKMRVLLDNLEQVNWVPHKDAPLLEPLVLALKSAGQAKVTIPTLAPSVNRTIAMSSSRREGDLVNGAFGNGSWGISFVSSATPRKPQLPRPRTAPSPRTNSTTTTSTANATTKSSNTPHNNGHSPSPRSNALYAAGIANTLRASLTDIKSPVPRFRDLLNSS